jgi:type I restriction enzyme, R subunit
VGDIMTDDVLRTITLEVAQTVWQNTTIDWAVGEQAQAQPIQAGQVVLRKYGYPPELQEKATGIVLEQAKEMARFIRD